MNEALFIGMVIFYLGSVILMYKLFGKNALFVFSVFGTLLGNIAVCKCIDLFGFSATAGNVLYAALFLITDILSEKYGKAEAKKAVKYSFVIMLLWLIGSQLILMFEPNANDYINDSLKVVFGIVPRITIASLLGYICSQNIDVFLYHLIWEKTGEGKKMLWLRNNGSTLVSQAIDTLIFVTLAFWGTYPKDVFISVLLTTYLFKAVVALLDTPFIYIARKIKPVEE
ncbi:MAG: queuosine precursor transporter [Lachnospiraceae bacterium]|nr:queuosine precursor transporter [Lachnospiraceae bacterium]